MFTFWMVAPASITHPLKATMIYMNKTTLSIFAAVVLAIAAYTVITGVEPRTTISQNPLPACPPFCEPDPNTGPETARR